MLEELLAERALPDFLSADEMKDILQKEEYGYMPEIPYTWKVDNIKDVEERLDNGHAAFSRAEMTVTTEYGSHTFPIGRLLHDDGKKHPVFIFMNFSPNVPHFYYPAEIIAERGFDVLSFYYADAAGDDNNFDEKLAKVLMNGDRSAASAPGKIMLWAFTCMRLADYAETLESCDTGNMAVLGHSRLGKTALVTGMMDSRFKYVISNDSGCAGASLFRGSLGQTGGTGKNGGTGESLEVIHRVFPYWFCPGFEKYAAANYPEGFDQHFLLAASFPRYVHVASSDLDDWADPASEQLCCLAAGKYWEKNGLTGFIHNDRILDAGEHLYEGHVGYHRRSGKHFLSYHDWNEYMDFIELHKNDKE